jgi:hypothetical protein
MGGDRRRAAAHPHQSDPHLQYPEDRIVRTRSFELSQVGRSVPGARSAGVSPLAERRYALRGLLRSVALGYLFFPDAQTGWYPGARGRPSHACTRALRRDLLVRLSGHGALGRSDAQLPRAPALGRRLPGSMAGPTPARHPYPRRAEALEPALALGHDRRNAIADLGGPLRRALGHRHRGPARRLAANRPRPPLSRLAREDVMCVAP